MSCRYPAASMSIKGILRYSVMKNFKVLNVEQKIPVQYLFRPLSMSTEEFGQCWTATGNDARKHLKMKSKMTFEETINFVKEHLNFFLVEIIGR